jgi:hypothetical protein
MIELIDHRYGLPHRFRRELRIVHIAPLQRKILPDQHAGFVRLTVEILALDVRVHADRIDARLLHQAEIEPIERGRHLAEPLRCDVVGAAQEDAAAVQLPLAFLGIEGNRAKAEDAADAVDHRATAIDHLDIQTIQVRMPTFPDLPALHGRDIEHQRQIRFARRDDAIDGSGRGRLRRRCEVVR